MFGRDTPSRQPKPNQLSDEAESNTLSWAAPTDGDPDSEQGFEAALYGPNSESVASMLAELDVVDVDQAVHIADAWEAVPAAERQASQMIVRRLRRQRELERWLQAAESHVNDWLAAQRPRDNDEAEVYAEAADAMRDAVDALILDQELADADFAVLYGAWSDVMDQPAEGEDDEDQAGEEESEDEEEPEDEEESEDEEEPEDKEEEELVFGPNTDLVEEFLGLLDGLGSDRIGALAAAWKSQPPIALRKAHEALQTLAREDPLWWAQIHDAQAAVSGWARPRALHVASHPQEGVDMASLRRAVMPAAVDAVSALVMADMLETEEAATLYGPWAQVIGKPLLPDYEGEDEGEGGQDEPS